MPTLHPDLVALAALLGTWEGRGEGHYPTPSVEDFAYLEQVTFGHVGKPFLTYAQRTRHPDEGHPMHAEVGFLRPAGEGRVEFLLAHPTGIVEVEEGSFDGSVLELETTSVGTSATAKDVRALRRRFEVGDDVLTYDLWMSYGDQDDEHHLHAELHRAGAKAQS